VGGFLLFGCQGLFHDAHLCQQVQHLLLMLALVLVAPAVVRLPWLQMLARAMPLKIGSRSQLHYFTGV
jgi:hypothetical protein